MVNGTVRLFPDRVAAVLPLESLHWLFCTLPPPAPSVMGPRAPLLSSLNRYNAFGPGTYTTMQLCAAKPTDPKSRYTACKSEAPFGSVYTALRVPVNPEPLLGLTDTALRG